MKSKHEEGPIWNHTNQKRVLDGLCFTLHQGVRVAVAVIIGNCKEDSVLSPEGIDICAFHK